MSAHWLSFDSPALVAFSCASARRREHVEGGHTSILLSMSRPNLSLFVLLFTLLSSFLHANASTIEKRASRTSPPSGAVVVRKSGTQSGEYTTVQAAVNALPNDSSARTIFIYSGTYNEEVYISRPATILGSTTDTTGYVAHYVTITQATSAGQIGGNNDLTATLRVHKDRFFLSNVNLENTFGPHPPSGGQALALSAYGTKTRILRRGLLRVPGYRSGATREPILRSTDNSIFVINRSTITTSSAATRSLTSLVYLGRPRTQYARVVYTSCSLGNLITSAGCTGAGAAGTRASFSKKLSSDAGYTAADVLGSNWTTWVDQAYV
ncbi:hypothetical protein LshimejAT787_0411400 [Lyophyllum shimeji]|uniref:pectinesterase n=1 Tax=Lyophyllum shimeji TaxID=47721 RepID=A0A9P3PMA8_LYOSH|nr:hypothetical protein LshimejAT787_0411400 [Lyophyllum shimeji]